MARGRATHRPTGSPENPSRSVRVDDTTWNKAVTRATTEQTTISAVIVAFIRGYADNHLNMPTTQVIYTDNEGSP